MQEIQEFLTISIVLIFAIVTTVIAIDLFTDLVLLWNRIANHVNHGPQLHPQASDVDTNEYTELANDVKPQSTAPADSTPLNTGDDVNTESLELLIIQLPQPRIRTAARRLGIADKVDGRYQKLGILRSQLQAKLKSQPVEVAQVLNGLVTQASKSKQRNIASQF